MAKEINEKEEEYKGLENLTKKQKYEFDQLLINYTEASENQKLLKKSYKIEQKKQMN